MKLKVLNKILAAILAAATVMATPGMVGAVNNKKGGSGLPEKLLNHKREREEEAEEDAEQSDKEEDEEDSEAKDSEEDSEEDEKEKDGEEEDGEEEDGEEEDGEEEDGEEEDEKEEVLQTANSDENKKEAFFAIKQLYSNKTLFMEEIDPKVYMSPEYMNMKSEKAKLELSIEKMKDQLSKINEKMKQHEEDETATYKIKKVDGMLKKYLAVCDTKRDAIISIEQYALKNYTDVEKLALVYSLLEFLDDVEIRKDVVSFVGDLVKDKSKIFKNLSTEQIYFIISKFIKCLDNVDDAEASEVDEVRKEVAWIIHRFAYLGLMDGFDLDELGKVVKALVICSNSVMAQKETARAIGQLASHKVVCAPNSYLRWGSCVQYIGRFLAAALHECLDTVIKNDKNDIQGKIAKFGYTYNDNEDDENKDNNNKNNDYYYNSLNIAVMVAMKRFSGVASICSVSQADFMNKQCLYCQEYNLNLGKLLLDDASEEYLHSLDSDVE